MNKYFYIYILTTIITLTTSCATTDEFKALQDKNNLKEEEELKRLIHQQNSLTQFALSIALNGIEICKNDIAGYLGATIASKDMFPKELRNASVRLFNNNSTPVVVSIIPGSPAELSGIQVGDIILKIAEAPVHGNRADIDKALSNYSIHARANNEVKFEINRAGDVITKKVKTEIICDYPVIYLADESIKVIPDGKNVFISDGFLNAVENDSELAYAISKSFAHNIENHSTPVKAHKITNIFFDLLGDFGVPAGGLIGIGMDYKERDINHQLILKAEYIGLYLMANAGFDISNAKEVVKEITGLDPDDPDANKRTIERFDSIDKTLQEIAEKKLKGQPLLPNE